MGCSLVAKVSLISSGAMSPPLAQRRFVAEVLSTAEGPAVRDLLAPRSRLTRVRGDCPPVGSIVVVTQTTVPAPEPSGPISESEVSTLQAAVPTASPSGSVQVPAASPSGSQPSLGRAVEVYANVEGEPLASPGSARAKLYLLAADEGLSVLFPEAVESEVRAIEAAMANDEQAFFDAAPGEPPLEDFTGLPFVTIDGPTSRDLDQALFVSRDGDDLIVRYAIADASYFVKAGSALFAEALKRGTSFYLPGLVVPMLPRALSEGLTSLNPNVVRRALVFTHRVVSDGTCVATSIQRGRIRSRAKLSFPQVQAFYDAPEAHPLANEEFADSLRWLREVGNLRMREADSRQVVRYRRLEVEVEAADVQGLSLVVVGVVRSAVERYNEQLSLLCNAEGGRALAEGHHDRVQGIYRAHPAPPVERLLELESLVQGVVEAHSLDPERWGWHLADTRTISEYLDGLPIDGPLHRVAEAIQRQAVITNLRSLYTSEPASHHGVGAKPYARFSAPMREIVGVFVHKELVEKLGLAAPRPDAEDVALRDLVIDAAARARDTQARLDHEVNRLVLDQIFGDDAKVDLATRPIRIGTVMGMAPSKVHVQLDSPPLDVKLYLRDLEQTLGTTLSVSSNGALLLDAANQTLLAVGDAVSLRVVRRDRERDRWSLEPVGGLRATPFFVPPSLPPVPTPRDSNRGG